MPSTVHENRPARSAPAVRVEGHVDPSTGNLDVAGDLHVGGNVVDHFQVRCGGDVHVAGVIEAADVQAGGDIHAAGGISGKERGHCRSGGAISARYVTNATVETVGDVTLQTELSNSRLICHGDLRVERGALLGGHATVLGSVHCISAGSSAATGAATLIEVGICPSLRDLAAASLPEIERLRRRAEQVRASVAPLMKCMKHLSPGQKEQVTEMLFESDELDARIEELLGALREGWNAWVARPESELRVAEALNPGVTVRFPGVQAVIGAAFSGPLRLVARATGRQKYVSLVTDERQAGSPMSSRPWLDPVMEELARAMA